MCYIIGMHEVIYYVTEAGRDMFARAQQADIKAAKRYWRDWQRRYP